MSVDERPSHRAHPGRLRRFARSLLGALGPTERSILTREGFFYFLVSLSLLVAGLIQQVNLILLVFTLAAGPFLASIFKVEPLAVDDWLVIAASTASVLVFAEIARQVRLAVKKG